MSGKLIWKPVFLPCGLCIKDGILWSIQVCGNQIIGVDINTFKLQESYMIPCVPWGSDYYHRGINDRIIDAGDRLIILLNGSDAIYFYDFFSHEVKKLTSFPNGKKFCNNAIIYKNGVLYFFPFGSNKILQYNYVDNHWNEILIANKNLYMRNHFTNENDFFYFVDDVRNVIYEYNIVQNHVKEICVGKEENRYWGIEKKDEYFVLPHQNKKIVTLWCEETGKTIDITDFPETYYGDEGWTYLSMYKVKESVLIFPHCANMILRVDVKNRTIVQEFPKIVFQGNNLGDKRKFSGAAYLTSIQRHKMLYLYSVLIKSWQVIDLDNMDMKNYFIDELCETDDKKNICVLFDDRSKKYFWGNESEFNCCNLNNFILSVNGLQEKSCGRENVHTGRAVWERCIKEEDVI